MEGRRIYHVSQSSLLSIKQTAPKPYNIVTRRSRRGLTNLSPMEAVSDTLDAVISGVDQEILVDVVKSIQKQGMKGSQGEWKEFLNSFDRKHGDTLSDPSKRSLDVLTAFLKSFNQFKDLVFIGKVIRQYTDHKAFQKYAKESPDEETPEQRLVRLTMEHPLYRKHYFFPSYDKDWVFVPPCDISNAMKSKQMVALDCEMVLCQDGTEEVVKVCVVDKKLKVKLESLVHPNKVVADYRTHITGISATDLVGVTCSLVDIKESMKKLLKKGAVLIGHSLHNDMRALKIDYHRVIDTSFIFKYSDVPPPCTPSLNSLCKAVLSFSLREEGEPHDCRKDAESAMKLVLAKLEHGFDEPINVSMNVSDVGRAKLLLHRISVEIPCQELHKLFPQDLNIDIQTDLIVRGPFYSTTAVFKDVYEADKAFQEMEGQEGKDNFGRLQKCVRLQISNGQITTFFVRKMAVSSLPEYGNSSLKKMGRDAKRKSYSTEAHEPKVQRTPLVIDKKIQDSELKRVCLSEFCDHAKEVNRLKQELYAREDEIFSLQKNVAALIKKHKL